MGARSCIGMFDSIACEYDGLNRIVSLGLDRSWRRRTARALLRDDGGASADPGLHDRHARVLDLATGTGDLAVAIASEHLEARIWALDASERMLDLARRKIARLGLDQRVGFILGDACALPFPELYFDAAATAFGLRNFEDRPRALAEIARVLRPGGTVAILEATEPEGRVIGALARLYIHRVLPLIGAIAGHASAYRYLEHSIARFPRPARVLETMGEAGFDRLSCSPLLHGAATLFVGRRGER
jgi:demethylmenaquinone methyltransferase/2-methoxy-6-polyprenyl-1,4-benzoquinol methylase